MDSIVGQTALLIKVCKVLSGPKKTKKIEPRNVSFVHLLHIQQKAYSQSENASQEPIVTRALTVGFSLLFRTRCHQN